MSTTPITAVPHGLVFSFISFFCAAGIGFAIGKIKIKGAGLGTAGCLFAGLVLSHFGYTLDLGLLDFLKELGLMLFIFTIGLQVGPSFFSTLKSEGLRLNAVSLTMIATGTITAIGLALLFHNDAGATAGLLAGGTTNTPSLGAAQQLLREGGHSLLTDPALTCALAYPFGLFGNILSTFLFCYFKKSSESKHPHQTVPEKAKIIKKYILIRPGLSGTLLSTLQHNHPGVKVSRVYQNNEEQLAYGLDHVVLKQGSVLLAVGTATDIDTVAASGGEILSGDHLTSPLISGQNLMSKRILVTTTEAVGRRLKDISCLTRLPLVVTRLRRGEHELVPLARTRVQYGDVIRVVGEKETLEAAEKELGGSLAGSQHASLLPLLIGLVLGVAVGAIPIPLPLVPSPLKLGLAGGPLVVALVLGRLGRTGPMVWFIPAGSSSALKELGMIFFLTCLGLASGDRFFDVLVSAKGLLWCACGVFITLMSMIAGIAMGKWLHLPTAAVAGILSGGMTNPPALEFSQTTLGSDRPALSYAAVYPLTMIMRVLIIQLVLLALLSFK